MGTGTRRLPVVQNLEAARFSLFIQLAAAIILAVGLDRVRAGGWLPSAAARSDRRLGMVPGPQRMECARPVDSVIGVRAEVVPQALDKRGRQPSARGGNTCA